MPKFVAIVGPGGSGKTRLADKIAKAFPRRTAHLVLTDFHRDRPDLSSPEERALSLDDPGAVDWDGLEETLAALERDEPADVSRFDPASCRRKEARDKVHPAPLVLVEGQWLLHREPLRQRFSLALFIHCSTDVCLQRRRDRGAGEQKNLTEAGRGHFEAHVEAMTRRHVLPQAVYADRIITSPPTFGDLEAVLDDCRALLD